jgi:hypothetical protein
MLKITVELAPHGDEAAAEVIAFAKVCNLRRHEPGSELGSYHAYFEAHEVPRSEPGPYMPDDPRRTYHKVGDAIVEDYPRREGSVWDLIATMLDGAGFGRPDQPVVHDGLKLSAIGGR